MAHLEIWTPERQAADEEDWRLPNEQAGGQAAAIDAEGDACCAFQDHRTGKWYYCSNIVDPDLEFTPQRWRQLPR